MTHSFSLLDGVGGLPVHPLVVHAAVVLTVVACLGLLVLLVVPRWRLVYGWLTWATLGAGSVAVLVSKFSGERLADHVGLPADHSEWADRLVVATAVLDLLATAWLGTVLLAHRRFRTGQHATESGSSPVALPRRRGLTTALGVLTALGSVLVLALSVATGHSGATAAWSGTLNQHAGAATAQPSSGAFASTGTSGSGYTMAQVATHNSAQSCWSAIDKSVYNLTPWINQHPGGSDKILALCGKDGTAAFQQQHGGQSRPAQELASLRVGTLRS